jgi:hypothetical protein
MEAARDLPDDNGDFAMATPTDTHAEPVNNETPSQGIFMGWLALGLGIFAVAFAAFAIFSGLSHPPV